MIIDGGTTMSSFSQPDSSSEETMRINRVTYTSLLILGLTLLSTTFICVKGAKQKLEPTRTLIDGDKKVLAYDNVLHPRLSEALSSFVRRYGGWDFVYPDTYESFKDRNNGNLHWIAPMSPKWFSNTKVWKSVELRVLNNIWPEKLYPYQVEGVMLRRGDFPKVHQGINNGLFMLSMVNQAVLLIKLPFNIIFSIMETNHV